MKTNRIPASSIRIASQDSSAPPASHTLWLTGLSGAGKSTLATHVADRLRARQLPVCILDGDALRHGLSFDLGFSRDDRAEQCRRTAEIAKLLNDQGISTIVALISPYEADRQRARAIIGTHRFVEVYLKTDIAVCSARDPKHWYAQAMTGQTPRFTGVSDPYEQPVTPDLVIETGMLDVAASVEQILAFNPIRVTAA